MTRIKGGWFEPEFVGQMQLLGLAYIQKLKEIQGWPSAPWEQPHVNVQWLQPAGGTWRAPIKETQKP